MQFDLRVLRNTTELRSSTTFSAFDFFAYSSAYLWRATYSREDNSKKEMISNKHLLLCHSLLTILCVSLLFHDSLNFNLFKEGYL